MTADGIVKPEADDQGRRYCIHHDLVHPVTDEFGMPRCPECGFLTMRVSGSGLVATGAELAEIVADDDLALAYWKRRQLGDYRPAEPEVTVPADLFAQLLACARRLNRSVSKATFDDGLDRLRDIDEGAGGE